MTMDPVYFCRKVAYLEGVSTLLSSLGSGVEPSRNRFTTSSIGMLVERKCLHIYSYGKGTSILNPPKSCTHTLLEYAVLKGQNLAE